MILYAFTLLIVTYKWVFYLTLLIQTYI